ncbi:sensor histidine kinase [Halomonas elongata]|uniref:histidine kinase n=1 Tax=Halomonas elongata (strain ATCC 33173 / DSM 2581 / NBRC 15536 / NCIMB 2198 / 1H9) TaxID=768066 RepID=E1V3E6_HALED|nr:sensor histidine kinase [Halomonas elongata]WBF19921.1 sensor histidine kinase [Halomonas elongata]WPU48790.1 sensor histidine kinase [Halomonas elongata DSM 2581]CBV42625.1 SSS family transport domain protein / histidine kinase domain protein [Halomonas elongata DSM 2581]
MRDDVVVLAIAFGYLALLFVIAAWGDRRAEQGRSVIGSPTVYALSIAVYCTAWTFYGSVGRAAEAGPGFLLIYLGPTLAMLMAPLVIRKMVRIAATHRITSIADFISARYGKSAGLGALVAVIALIGTTPYIALQLKAITLSHAVLVDYAPESPMATAEASFWADRSFWVALVLAVFIILFGTRHLDASERHEGMVAAIAFESLVKLAAFLAVGIFTVFVLYQGPGDLFRQVAATPALTDALSLESVPGGALGWVGMLVLAFLAFLGLPRQFQVLVVENVDERHIQRAAWLFPLYLLVINLFVIPIAMAGLLGGTGEDPDSFVLTLPMAAGVDGLPVLVFIGGLSAATGMMIVETIALSTMVSNQLVMPLLLRSRHLHRGQSGSLASRILGIRRIAILGILLLGYSYHALIGDAYSLVTIGLVSFAAVAQFTPALLIGLYWRSANRLGAGLGMTTGILIWAWTLLIPGFAQSGWLNADLLTQGPFGIDWLRPYALFGLEGWDIYTHSLFWSLSANIGLLVGASLFSRASPLEQTQAALFTEALHPRLDQSSLWRGHTLRGELRALLDRYLGTAATQRVFADHSPDDADDQSASTALVARAEQALAGALGNASARVLIDSVVRGEALDLDSILRILDTTSETLEMNRRLEQKSRELARIGQELREANDRLRELDRLKDEFVAMVSHELRTPLTSIRAFAEILRDNRELPEQRREHFLDVVVRESQRLSRLIEEILDLARLESGRLTLEPQRLDLVPLTHQALEAIHRLQEERGIALETAFEVDTAEVIGDPDRLEQVIINLIDNAGKFADAETPRISLHLTRHKHGFRLAVADNGPGIDEAERERVFEKFHQLPHADVGTMRSRPRGSGLGLPISRGIVAHLGGRLWIEDAAELGGACLVMELPEAPSEDRNKNETEA